MHDLISNQQNVHDLCFRIQTSLGDQLLPPFTNIIRFTCFNINYIQIKLLNIHSKMGLDTYEPKIAEMSYISGRKSSK